MSKAEEQSITMPLFNDFIYNLLYKTGVSAKRLLKGRYQKYTFTEAGAKRFIRTATREEKELLLAELGFSFFYMITPKNLEIDKLREIFKKFKTKQKGAALAQMAEEGIFVIGDEQLVYYAGLMTKSIHSPTFFLNLELVRQGYNINKWSKRLKSKLDLSVREAAESDSEICRLLINTLNAISYTKGWLGLSEREMLLLLFFYVNRSRYVDENELKQKFIGTMSPTEFRYAIKGLLKGYCIDKSLIEKESYSICTQGIRKVIEFRNKILNIEA